VLDRDVTTGPSGKQSWQWRSGDVASSADRSEHSRSGSDTEAAAAIAGGRWGTGTVSMPLLLRLLIAVLSGLAMGFGFQPYAIWPLSFVGIAGLAIAAHGTRARRAFLVGYLFGVAMLGVAISWVRVIIGGGGVAILGVVGLIGFEALAFALAGVAFTLVGRLRGWPVLAAAAWTGVEYLYAHYPFGGFGWTRIGYTAVDSPVAGLYPIIGVAGVSFVMALLGLMVGWLVLKLISRLGERSRGTVRSWLVRLAIPPAAVWLIVIGSGFAFADWNPGPASGTGKSAKVGIVQGNVPGKGIDALGRMRTVTENHLQETTRLMDRVRNGNEPKPDFVLWPENSTDIDPTHDPITHAQVQSAAHIAGVPIFVGAAMDGPGPDQRQISGLWWDPHRGGPVARYNKRNLVPFGEWIPFRDQLLPLFPVLKLVGAQGVPGTKPGALTVPMNIAGHQRQVTVGDMICFELAYDDTVYDTVTHGAQLLTVQSNNATYIGTGQVDQQFAITRARAMELRREIAVATTNGVSGVIQRDGSVSWKSQERTAASTVATMPLRDRLTPAVRIAPWLDRGLGLLGLAACVVGIIVARNRSVRARLGSRQA
jgi:apolipoprotein N-acyltransferase